MAQRELVATIMDEWGRGSIPVGQVSFTYSGSHYPVTGVNGRGISYGHGSGVLSRNGDVFPINSMTVRRTVKSVNVNFVIGDRLR